MKTSARLLGATMMGAAAIALMVPAAAQAQTDINIVAFAPGFAWGDMFGPSGTDKTDKLRAFEEANDININIEFADEDTGDGAEHGGQNAAERHRRLLERELGPF